MALLGLSEMGQLVGSACLPLQPCTDVIIEEVGFSPTLPHDFMGKWPLTRAERVQELDFLSQHYNQTRQRENIDAAKAWHSQFPPDEIVPDQIVTLNLGLVSLLMGISMAEPEEGYSDKASNPGEYVCGTLDRWALKHSSSTALSATFDRVLTAIACLITCHIISCKWSFDSLALLRIPQSPLHSWLFLMYIPYYTQIWSYCGSDMGCIPPWASHNQMPQLRHYLNSLKVQLHEWDNIEYHCRYMVGKEKEEEKTTA